MILHQNPFAHGSLPEGYHLAAHQLYSGHCFMRPNFHKLLSSLSSDLVLTLVKRERVARAECTSRRRIRLSRLEDGVKPVFKIGSSYPSSTGPYTA